MNVGLIKGFIFNSSNSYNNHGKPTKIKKDWQTGISCSTRN